MTVTELTCYRYGLSPIRRAPYNSIYCIRIHLTCIQHCTSRDWADQPRNNTLYTARYSCSTERPFCH